MGAEKDDAIDEVVYYTEEALNAMKGQSQEMEGRESLIYPVIRSTSFPEKSSAGVPLIFDGHTAETRIYYALDLGNTYRLIDEKCLKKRAGQRKGFGKRLPLTFARSKPLSKKTQSPAITSTFSEQMTL